MTPNELVLCVVGGLQGFLTVPVVIRLPFVLAGRIGGGADVPRAFTATIAMAWVILGIVTMAAIAMAWIMFISRNDPAAWVQFGKAWGQGYYPGVIAYFVLLIIHRV